MRLDTANRSFAGLMGVGLLVGMFVFCGAVGCVLIVLVATRIGDGGLAAITGGGHWLALVFIVIVGAGAVLGLWSLGVQIRASRRLARRVGSLGLPLTGELETAARRAGLAGRVKLVDSDECFSFAYGALTPRVALSRGLLETASGRELDAVLQHERYHVRNLDPLKVLLARAAPATFFYLPVLRGLQERYVAGRELAADRRAVSACGRQPLAAALFKVVRGPEWRELQMAAAIGGPELLDVRVSQLESGREPSVVAPSATALVLSLLAGAALVGLFVASVLAFGGPSAVTRTTGAGFSPLDVAGGLLCAVPWVAVGWLGFRWLARRSRHPLTRRSSSTTLSS